MPGPGAVSFISNFVQGYTGKMREMQDEKEKKVEALMRIADDYYKKAMDPSSPPHVQEYYERAFTEKHQEAEKEANRKVSGITDIFKSLFGVGKGPKPTQGGAYVPVRQIEQMFGTAYPAGGQQPQYGVRPPTAEDAGYDPNVPVGPGGGEGGLFRLQKQFEANQAGPVDELSGLNSIARLNLKIKDAEAAIRSKYGEKEAGAEFERKKLFEKFRADMSQGERENNLKIYRNSPAYDVDQPHVRAEKETAIMLGAEWDPKGNYEKVMKLDPDTGEPFYQYVDMNDPKNRDAQYPVIGSASYQNEIRQIMAEDGIPWREAEKKYAQIEKDKRKTQSEKDELALRNQRLLAENREETNRLRKAKEEGKFGPKEAKELYWLIEKRAESRMSSEYIDPALRDATKTKYMREELEGSSIRPGWGMTLEDLIKMQTRQEGETEEEIANRYIQGRVGAIGGAGAQPGAGAGASGGTPYAYPGPK